MVAKKKSLIIVSAVIAVILAVSVSLLFFFLPVGDTTERYLDKVLSLDFFENDMYAAVPQTEIYAIVKDHFAGPLAEGKTVKKAIVIGYDGCRLDTLINAQDSNGGMSYILSNGGKAYISYCGGKKYPEKNTQATSTAPGWCSMLTGQWADVHGITDNKIIKSNDHLTLLTTLVEQQVIEKSAFYVSWKGHFVDKKSTYKAELDYITQKNLNVDFAYSKDDDGTKSKVYADLHSAECSDFIFSILEYCDHAGHSKVFFPERKSYKNAFYDADRSALDIINAVLSRDTYQTEDWLILLTTDHGGYSNNHGGKSIQERYTFIFANKPLF